MQVFEVHQGYLFYLSVPENFNLDLVHKNKSEKDFIDFMAEIKILLETKTCIFVPTEF